MRNKEASIDLGFRQSVQVGLFLVVQDDGQHGRIGVVGHDQDHLGALRTPRLPSCGDESDDCRRAGSRINENSRTQGPGCFSSDPGKDQTE